mmetsp:Transcript_60040/g.82222  ORF Transcript_60040/g.82222 Transcript_60040/m.82222 type:complete len:106 (+) Transcript_60040:1476-1793(+)
MWNLARGARLLQIIKVVRFYSLVMGITILKLLRRHQLQQFDIIQIRSNIPRKRRPRSTLSCLQQQNRTKKWDREFNRHLYNRQNGYLIYHVKVLIKETDFRRMIV